jgi:hypothetical protein
VIAKVPKPTATNNELLNQPGSKPMDFTGKPMRGFLFIGADGIDSEDDLDFWVMKALEFNKLLNP